MTKWFLSSNIGNVWIAVYIGGICGMLLCLVLSVH